MYKKHFKTFIVSFLIILSVYFFIQGPVFRYFNVQKTESAEYIAMPLQMVGRMAYKDVKFTKEEKKLINNLIPIDVLPSAYNPATSNGIKFNSKYNAKVFDKNKSKYFKLWLSLVTKHPDVALEAYFNSTLGYWYPGLSFWAAATSTYLGNDYGIKNNAISDSVKNFTLYLENRNTPVFNIQWSIGLYFWFISILIYVAIKKYGSKIITVYIPVIGIWITLMIASPVFGEFRYIFSALTCLPFYIFINYSNNDFSKKIHKQKKK